MKISVIVPIYNSFEYLDKCISSIINQSIGFKNIELILVNDGSTDNSEKIIKKYTKKYKNIIYIDQANGGQANARNNGLKIASGEYVSFVDSDDWLNVDMYKILLENNRDFDIITCDYSAVKNNTYEYTSFRNCFDEQKNFIIMNMGPCNMIIKRSFLIKTNFSFPEGIIYEDLACIPVLGVKTNKIKYVEKALYYYNIHDNSTMKMCKYSDKIEDIFKSINILYDKWAIYDEKKEFYSEIEYIFIRRFLMSASLRFIEWGDPNNCIEKISNEVKKKFPLWMHNEYYKKLPFKQKIVAILSYKKKKKLLMFLYKLNNKGVR